MSLWRCLVTISVGVGISLSQLESVFAQSQSPSKADSNEQQQNNNSLQLPTSPNQVKIQQVRSITLKQALELAEQNNRIGLRDAQLLEEGGTGSKIDTIRASVQLKNAEQNLTQAQTDRDIASDKLTRILSLPETVDVAAADPVQTAGQWNRSLEESIILAFQNRAEFKQQSIQRNISSQQRQIALAEIRPTVSLFANYQALSELSNKGADGYAAGARVAWNFFDGGTASAAAKQEDANIKIAETRFADTRSQIRLEIEQAYKNLMANAKNIEMATAALEQAQEALELISFGYRRGATTQLEVNTAQNELTNAAGNKVKAILNYNRSLTSLRRAINNL